MITLNDGTSVRVEGVRKASVSFKWKDVAKGFGY